MGQTSSLPTGWLTGWTADRILKVAVKTRRTLLLSGLVLLGLTTLLRVLTDGESRPLRGDRWFRALAAAAVPVYLAAMYWQPAAQFFELTPLGLAQWGLVLAVVLPAALAAWGSDRVWWLGGRGDGCWRSVAGQPR